MATPAAAVPQTMDQKIDAAVQQGAKIAELFAPQAAAAIEAGVAVEPVIHGFIGFIIALFRHHTTKA